MNDSRGNTQPVMPRALPVPAPAASVDLRTQDRGLLARARDSVARSHDSHDSHEERRDLWAMIALAVFVTVAAVGTAMSTSGNASGASAGDEVRSGRTIDKYTVQHGCPDLDLR